ncbi:hypothetical protein BD779DRAFT_1494809 [Infundibulicybe gibba]|nr:hypothetical protein BD779DRAFT_1494809 [Infundibulicybe gibba]
MSSVVSSPVLAFMLPLLRLADWPLMLQCQIRHGQVLEHMRSLNAYVCLSLDYFSNSRIFGPAPSELSKTIHGLPTLHDVNGSIPSWPALMTLYEKEIHSDARRVKVTASPKETHTLEFRALNHRGKTLIFVGIGPSSFIYWARRG